MKTDILTHGRAATYLILSFFSVALGQENTNVAQPPPGMKLVSVESAEKLVSVPGASMAINLPARGGLPIPVDVSARRYEFKGPFRGNPAWTFRLVEFQIRSREGSPFVWHCWEGADKHPHDFKLFTTLGTTYACFTSSEGVTIFRVREGNNSEGARECLLNGGRSPGALPPLRIGVIGAAVGPKRFYGVNALYWTIIVETISEDGSELRVTLHGDKPDPKFTFAFRNDEWEFVSGTE